LSESWVIAAADYLRVFISFVVPMLLIAAFLESYLTPQILLRIYGS
jgi:uncharacterized membrane protein SpoIIM required for sporulation